MKEIINQYFSNKTFLPIKTNHQGDLYYSFNYLSTENWDKAKDFYNYNGGLYIVFNELDNSYHAYLMVQYLNKDVIEIIPNQTEFSQNSNLDNDIIVKLIHEEEKDEMVKIINTFNKMRMIRTTNNGESKISEEIVTYESETALLRDIIKHPFFERVRYLTFHIIDDSVGYCRTSYLLDLTSETDLELLIKQIREDRKNPLNYNILYQDELEILEKRRIKKQGFEKD